jgi:pyrroline-5-carboxylate reductase
MRAAIGFIGAGKMAEALIGGLLAKGVFSKDDIVACAPSEATRSRISTTYGIKMYPRAKDMCADCDMVVIAVKPKHVAGLFEDEGVRIGDGRIVISIVAGLTMDKLASYVPDAKIARVMPNHCCMVLEGAMGYTCDAKMTSAEKEKVADILESVGLIAEVPESQMDAITGIAGSSPAFMYMVIDAMADAGVLNGLSRDASIMLAAQSMLGAAKMVLETGKHPDVLRDEVCSPGGTTIEGVRTLEDLGLRSAMIAAIDNTIEKSRQMSRQRRRYDLTSPRATLGVLAMIELAFQSRSFLLAMVEFIILMPSSLVSQSLASRSSWSGIRMISSTLCIRSLANSVRRQRSSKTASSSLPA